MKREKTIYWITTSLIALSGLIAGIMYLTNPMIPAEFKHLGFPDYLRVELATAKLIGAVVLILPMIYTRIKEWAYAGFAITFISAAVAHLVVETPGAAISPLISLVLLIISYVYFSKLNNKI